MNNCVNIFCCGTKTYTENSKIYDYPQCFKCRVYGNIILYTL